MATDDDDRSDLGARLREAREYAGYSQEEVANHLRIPRSAVSLIETGSRRLDALELRRLSVLYQRSMEELAGHEAGAEDGVSMVARATAALSPSDRSEVLRFAQFLKERSADKRQ